ncbi:MAG: TolC family protein [Candidatus Omnitrophica bacterium]|nr:TolC family protein [Candidatus Omnitrophota bacterium]
MVKMKTIEYFKFVLILTITPLLIISCKTIKAPDDLKNAWVPSEREKNSQISDIQWQILKKRNIDISQPLGLVELTDIALSNSPLTRRAWENARAKEALQRQAQSTLYPQVTVSADGTKEKTVANIHSANTNEFRWGPSAKLTYLLFDFGGRGAAIEESAQAILSANFQFNQSLQDLLLATETAYYNLYSAQALWQASQANLKASQTSYESVEKKRITGLASKLDELQAKSNYDNALYLVEQTTEEIEKAKSQLAQVLGFPAGTEIKIAQPPQKVSFDITESDVNSLIEEALLKRQDISSLRADLQSKEAAIRVANSSLWPTLNVGGSGEKNWYKYYGTSGDRDDGYGYTAFLKLDWDIFDGFYNLNRKRQRQAEAEAQREILNQAELQASTQVWVAYYTFKASLKKLTYSQALYETTETAYELAIQSYRNGLYSILDLLQTQNELADARSKLVESQKQTYLGLANLAYATGSLGIQGKNLNLAKNITGGKR